MNKYYEDNEQEEELHKQLHFLFGGPKNDKNDKKIHDSYYKNDEPIITKAPTYHKRLCYKIQCPICNKPTNLNSINIHFKTKKCNIFRADLTQEELNKIERDIIIQTIKK
jgi:hypothetical protein